MLKGKSASESRGLHCSLAEPGAGAGWGVGVGPPTAGPREAGRGPGKATPQHLPPKASMFTLLRAPRFLRDHSGNRAFSKSPLSCPAVRGGFLLQVSWGKRRGRAEYCSGKKKKKIPRFFLGGSEGARKESYFGGEHQSVRGGRAGFGPRFVLWRYPCAVDAGVGAPGFQKSERVLLLSSQQIRLRPEEEYSLRR